MTNREETLQLIMRAIGLCRSSVGRVILRLFVILNKGDERLAWLDLLRLRKALGLMDSAEEKALQPSSAWQPEKKDMVLQCVDRTERIHGDIVELGVWRGGGTFLIADRLRQHRSKRRIWAIDSFEGLPQPTEADRMKNGHIHYVAGKFGNTSVNYLKKLLKLAGLSAWTVVWKGFFEDIVPQVFEQKRKFSLVIIDCDQYSGAKFCAEFFYDRISTGGILLVDDYGLPQDFGNSTAPGVKRALDEFLVDKREDLKHGAHSMWYLVKM